MSNFGEELRMERLSRGIALSEITAVTKISSRHLEALEQGKLPSASRRHSQQRDRARLRRRGRLGSGDWTERFLEASGESGQKKDEERGWVEFASNVGKARIQQSNAMEQRMRWIGVILLILVVAAGAFLGWRYYGLRAAGGQTFCPFTWPGAQSFLRFPFCN